MEIIGNIIAAGVLTLFFATLGYMRWRQWQEDNEIGRDEIRREHLEALGRVTRSRTEET